MTTLAEFMIIAGADNRPPMLEKSMYDSWKSRMEIYIENWENGRMILNSVQNGPLVWPTIIQEDGTTRTKKYEELSVVEKLQADCDLKAANIIQRISLTGFPAQSLRSSNTDVLDSPCLLVLINGTSQSRQHVSTSSIHIESCKSPTTELFEVDSGRISIRHCEY
ncbi:hypothetical protein Tco_1500094 [Tanacetum coccineum]